MKTKQQEEFNGYDFDNPQTRKKMKYLVVLEGDLDVNNAYAFSSKKELKEFFKESWDREKVEAVFEIKDITNHHGKN